MEITEEEWEINEEGECKSATEVDTKLTVVEKKKHYIAFEHKGDFYEVGDTVLLSPGNPIQKPDVAIIKKITEKEDGSMMLTCQLLYRPQNAVKRNGGRWDVNDNRELFYSFKCEEVPAESLMHKCVVHYIPLNKQLPIRSQNPGFIVQRVYCHEEKRLWKMTDKDYADDKQCEIDFLLLKTREHLDLPDIGTEEVASDDHELHQSKKKQCDVLRELGSGHQYLNEESNPDWTNDPFYKILANYGAITGDHTRDKWLMKLLESIEFLCDYSTDSDSKQMEHKDNADGPTLEKGYFTIMKYSTAAAVSALVALEQASQDVQGNDFKRYNQKMRQLHANLKNNEVLARRLLTGELEASVIVNMSPDELKEGHLTMEQTATSKKPAEESAHIQMTDKQCSICKEKKVGLKDYIIRAGGGERYRWDCNECGHTWVTSSR